MILSGFCLHGVMKNAMHRIRFENWEKMEELGLDL
jgi:hypothetical protein